MALSDNLIAYWSLDEASGNAIDAHAANDLTDTNTVGSATGKVSNARDFEASASEYFTIADNTDLSTGDIDFTFALWAHLESKSAHMSLLSKDDRSANGTEYALNYNLTSDRFQFYVSPNGTLGAVVSAFANNLGSPSTATWYFIVCWHDSVNNQIGVQANGTANTTAHSTGVFDTSAPFRLGALGNAGVPFDGLIDEVGFWKRVLTSDERSDLYNAGNGRDYAYIIGGGGGGGVTYPQLERGIRGLNRGLAIRRDEAPRKPPIAHRGLVDRFGNPLRRAA